MGNIYVSKVAELRKKKGLTQRQLAAELDVDVSTLRNWESNRDGVKMFVRVAKLCEALGCTPEDLYGEESIDEDGEQ